MVVKRMRRIFKVINGEWDRLRGILLNVIILTESFPQVFVTTACNIVIMLFVVKAIGKLWTPFPTRRGSMFVKNC